jgi:hypothetical protein
MSYSKIDGASVAIEFGYQKDFDRLLFDYKGENLKSHFEPETGVLSIFGRESTQAFVDAIRSVSFMTKAVDGKARQISWNFGNNTIFLTDTGHFYTMFYRRGLMWEDAVKVCTESRFFDMKGYLATLTAEHEYNDVVERFQADSWIGGSDAAQDGTWRWVTGPEGLENNGTGRAFWSGLSSFAMGTAIKGAFAAWARFQPDNERNEQHYMSLRHSAGGVGFYDESINAIQDGYLCEYGGLDAAEVTAHAKYYEGSVTLLPGCELLTKDDCVNSKAMGCAWTTTGCQIATCLAFKSEKECDANWYCHYNSEASPPICENTRCSAYNNKESCEADLTCTAKTAGITVQCVPAVCSDKKSSCKCNAIDDAPCTYNSDFGECVMNEFIDCPAVDVALLVDGTTGMGDAFGRHADGFSALMETTKDYAKYSPLTKTAAGTPPTNPFGMRFSIIQFGPAQPIAKMNGPNAQLSGDASEIATTTAYNEANFADEKASKLLVPAATLAINTLKDTPARKKVVVIVTQGDITDADAAALNVFKANPSIIVYGITLRREESHDALDAKADSALLKIVSDANHANIQLREFADTLVSMCDPTTSFGRVLANPVAQSKLCSRFLLRADCDGQKRCGWDASASVCRSSHCTLYCDTGACTPDTVCQFVPTATAPAVAACNRFVCTSFDITACGNNPLCKWANNKCASNDCISNPTEDSCEADVAGCVFNPNTQPKCLKRTCVSTDQRMCLQDKTCAWNGEKCYIDLCGKAGTNATACQLQPQCLWNAASNKCDETSCAKIQDEKKCDEDYMCGWNVKTVPPVCSPQSCGYYNNDATSAKAKCNADSACYWETVQENKQKDQCIDKTCKTSKTSCDCAKMPQCVWRDSQCRENRFVQCPAIDLVFLLEGSTIMTQTFGRHPNGFAALVQNIRTWAKEAPMTMDPNSPGFRVATIQYAPPKVAGVVSRDVGGGGNVTGDVKKVLAELEWHDNNLIGKGYDSSAMYLQPALQKAGEIIRLSPKPTNGITRKKLIMIMGNSKIADGTVISSDVATLRAAEVSIFSNDIRRFDVITDADKDVASMLRPLASDPQDTHFLYATVDNIDNFLLQKFCDPTTNVGAALQISKSGDIPCSWLSNKDECGGQSFCEWDPNAVPTCAESSQCPNLECQEIPKALMDQGFTCKNCKLTNGALECSKTSSNDVVKGGCVVSACTKDCTCAGTCQKDANRGLCTRPMCTAYSTESTCNKDYGCVWSPYMASNGGTAGCIPNACGSYRDFPTCDAQLLPVNGGQQFVDMCSWMTPACDNPPCAQLCRNQICPFYEAHQEACEANALCSYDAGRNCMLKQCQYNISSSCDEGCVISKCASDPNCYWDPYTSQQITKKLGVCKLQAEDCVLSPLTPRGPCSASCGAGRAVVRYQKILQQPQEGHPPCPPASQLVVTEKCDDATDTSKDDCTKFCSSKAESDCVGDTSCYWDVSGCKARSIGGCQKISDLNNCKDGCKVVDGQCLDDMNVCDYETEEQCTKLSCNWVEVKADSDSILYNPGDSPRAVLSRVSLAGGDLIDGAVVYIQENYQRGKDYLILSSGSSTIQAHWVDASGALHLYSVGATMSTVEDYGNAIANVMFYTSSTSTKERTISWSLGKDTFYHSVTQRHYRYFSVAAIGWLSAKTACSVTSLADVYRGYIASITTEAENILIASKMDGHGWLGGSDSTEEGMWRWTGGPDDGKDFWMGGPAAKGGRSVNGLFTQWEPPTASNQVGEPSNTDSAQSSGGEDFLYLQKTGYWTDKSSSVTGDGYVCEYKGLASDKTPTYALGGFGKVKMAGCFPSPCTWHTTGETCTNDLECMWTAGGCVVSCASQSTPNDCQSRVDTCRWDTEVLPPACTPDKCGSLGMTACGALSICRWDGTVGKCVYRTGCERNSENECTAALVGCYFNKAAGLCMAKDCDQYSADECVKQSLCFLKEGQCKQKTCEAVDDKACDADPKCNWLRASANFLGVPPGGAVVTPFANMTNGPNDASINVDGATVTISEGFEADSDILSCDSQDCPAGVLEVKYTAPTLVIKVVGNAAMNAPKMYQYVQLVKFRTSSNSPRKRTISYALGHNMVYVTPASELTGFGYFFKYVDTQVSTLDAADAVCRSKKFFGLDGYLATLTTERDTIAVKLLGAKGIIGAQDSTTNGDWSWNNAVAGGARTSFWNGYGSLGQPLACADKKCVNMYAQWELGQPIKATDGAGKAVQQNAFLLQSGKWMSVVLGSTVASGVVCRFGDGSKQTTTNAGSTRYVQPSGCFPRVCAQMVSESECRKNYLCDWRDNQCVSDERCGMRPNPTECNSILNCFWDYDQSSCIPGKRTMCNELNTQQFCQDPFFAASCNWDTTLKPAACTPKGCSRYPFKSVCSNDPTCRWLTKETLCVSRLCGYTKEDQCWNDKNCIFDHGAAIKTCTKSPCLGSTCSAPCALNNSVCTFQRCNAIISGVAPADQPQKCILDPTCVWRNNACIQPTCNTPELMAQKACDEHAECFFDGQSKLCSTDQCVMSGTEDLCKVDTTCMWDGKSCRHKTVIELNAPSDVSLDCPVHEENPNLWWLWLLLALIIIGLAGVMWRLYLAYKHGYSFTDPARYNKKFSAQEMYSKELADMADDNVRDNNDADVMNQGLLQDASSPAAQAQRPMLDDL